MKRLKHSLALYISLLTVALSGVGLLAYACADYDWESTYVSFFHKNLSDAPNTEPFYLTELTFFSDEPFEANDTPNMLEWRSYSKNEAKEDDVRWLLHKGNLAIIGKIQGFVNQKVKQLPDSIRKNSFVQYAIAHKDRELLDYLSYAMQCQEFVNLSAYDMWDYKAPEEATISKLLQTGEAGYKRCNSSFLKLRWGFQLARLAHYNGRYEQCLAYCKDYIQPINLASEVHGWALSLKAGSIFKSERKAEGIYLFSKVFDSCPKYRMQAFNTFRHVDNGLVNEALSLCQNNHEQAVLWAMRGYNSFNNTPEVLVKVSELDPTLPDLEVLLVREVNKIEAAIKSPISYVDTNATEIAQRERLTDSLSTILQPSIQKIAQNAKTKNPALWYTASGYIYFLNKSYANASQMLEKAEKLSPTEKVKGQITITKLLVEINRQKTISPESEKVITQGLEWLKAKVAKEGKPDYYSYNRCYYNRTYQSIASEVLAKKYLGLGNVPMAILCQKLSIPKFDYEDYFTSIGLYIDEHASIPQVEALIALSKKTNKTPLEKFVVTNAAISESQLNELIGTKYLRAYDFKQAEGFFKKLPANYWKGKSIGEFLNSDPFADNDNTKKAPKKSPRYTKLSFAQKMMEYTKLAGTADETGAAYTYLLANAYYNISHAGNSWAMVQYYWSGSEYDFCYTGPRSDPFKRDYQMAITAMNLYQKAASMTKKPEVKARCLFQASKCYGMQVAVWTWDASYEKQSPGPYLKENRYFKELKEKYRNTKYYKEVYAQCSYLQDYVNMN